MQRMIGVNERGLRVGESHQRAKLTDRDIELFWQLRDVDGWGCKRLAEKFEISHQYAARIFRGERRSQRAVDYRKIGAKA